MYSNNSWTCSSERKHFKNSFIYCTRTWGLGMTKMHHPLHVVYRRMNIFLCWIIDWNGHFSLKAFINLYIWIWNETSYFRKFNNSCEISNENSIWTKRKKEKKKYEWPIFHGWKKRHVLPLILFTCLNIHMTRTNVKISQLH